MRKISIEYIYSCFYNALEVSFGIAENELMDQVTVYPNPAISMV